jgi:3-dehydroquinate synthase
MSTDPVLVNHALGSYPVYVQPGVLAQLPRLTERHLAGRRIAMLADETVSQLYLQDRLGSAHWKCETLTFPAGERSKTREAWALLTDSLLERGFGRDSGIIALGGGVAGDLAGFVASTYLRGVPYLQVPTTLLAMVDASVGGKTGVDTAKGKNLVGSFHPPAAVIADPQTLVTLPERDYRAGLAEAVKHGLIADRDYFEWIEKHSSELARRDGGALTRLVRRSVEIKAEVVSQDEREAGRRAILNAGHTIAHALEQVSRYEMPHGEAVAVGLVLESRLAEHLGVTEPGLQPRLALLLSRLQLPVALPPGIDLQALVGSMLADKKNRAGEIHFALPASVGRMSETEGWTTAVPERVIEKILGLK